MNEDLLERGRHAGYAPRVGIGLGLRGLLRTLRERRERDFLRPVLDDYPALGEVPEQLLPWKHGFADDVASVECSYGMFCQFTEPLRTLETTLTEHPAEPLDDVLRTVFDNCDVVVVIALIVVVVVAVAFDGLLVLERVDFVVVVVVVTVFITAIIVAVGTVLVGIAGGSPSLGSLRVAGLSGTFTRDASLLRQRAGHIWRHGGVVTVSEGHSIEGDFVAVEESQNGERTCEVRTH